MSVLTEIKKNQFWRKAENEEEMGPNFKVCYGGVSGGKRKNAERQ